MIGLENVNCGDLKELEELRKGKINDYTTEQLLNENLKNVNGESNKEVRARMLEFVEYILDDFEGKRIAIVSHGGAIKFLLQNWCSYDYNQRAFFRNGKLICNDKIESPSILKLIFENKNLKAIEKLAQGSK